MKLEIGKTYRDNWGRLITIGGYTKDHPEWVWSTAGNWYVAETGQFLHYNKKLGYKTFPTNRNIVEEIKNDET